MTDSRIADESIALIPVGKKANVFAVVDSADFAMLSSHKWHLGCGYPRTHVDGKTVCMHQMLMTNEPGYETDHINRIRLDNRRSNLRSCTHKQNARNMSPRKDARSPYRGVSKTWDRLTGEGRWNAIITIDGRRFHLGRFPTQEQAAQVYNNAARDAFGEFAYINPV